jgi:hypothetical protein
MSTRIAASLRRAAGPEPGWVSQPPQPQGRRALPGPRSGGAPRGRSAAAGGRRRRLAVSADAVDPGINLIGVDIEAGGERGLGLRDALGFPGEAVAALGLGFRAEDVGPIVWARTSVHASNVVLAADNCQHAASDDARRWRRFWFHSDAVEVPSRFHGDVSGQEESAIPHGRRFQPIAGFGGDIDLETVIRESQQIIRNRNFDLS